MRLGRICSRATRLVPELALCVALGASDGRADGFSAWTESGFPGAESRLLSPAEIYPGGAPNLPLRLDATVVYDRGTAWTQARAVRQIRRTAGIFEPCGIALGRVRLARLRLPADQRVLDTAEAAPDTAVPPLASELSSKVPASATYPVAFLIARVEGTPSLAVSYRALDPQGPGASYFDTAWIGYRAHWLPRRDDRYSALAHEFAHLLCRCGHSRHADSHLLHSARNFLSADVLPEHCERFASSPLVSASH